ncbi:hypothetical protein DH2020_037595 [Rehmannia glutinosa]|uniref:AB hydrolase-1 domain-containing protein n=1 Tax=Rehmannia glutinosa TaxID=99300 RepID=A0ABR0V115_REHGL
MACEIMDKNEYHFVLVHGDCHGAWCWYKLTTLLRSAHHKVTALDMAGCGSDLKRVEEVRSITDYFEPLMLFMEGLPMDERVILVGHSRGGIDISIAMERFPEKIGAAVFVTASMPGPDLDLPTVSKEDLTLATFLIRPSPLFVDFRCPSKETALTKENYGSVPRVYIVCDEDNLMKDMQRWLIDNNPPDEVKVINGSDHMAMMSKNHTTYVPVCWRLATSIAHDFHFISTHAHLLCYITLDIRQVH